MRPRGGQSVQGRIGRGNVIGEKHCAEATTKTTGEDVVVTRKARFLAFALLFATQALAQNPTANTTPGSTQPLALASPFQGAYATSVPGDVLQLFQKQAASPPWSQDTPAKTRAILQECATLQQLLAEGATDGAISNSLAASTLRVSVFMTFGQSLYSTGDLHHAEMFFGSVVQDHPTRATAKQLGRCYLWLGKLYQADGLAAKYQQGDVPQASTAFEIAAADYLAAKDGSQDWVRSSGWLGAAACYRELGQHAMCRLCLTSLLQELAANTVNFTGNDASLGPVRRDIATHMLAASFYEDQRYAEAVRVYQQLLKRVTANSTEYPGQASYVGLANAGLSSCAARLAEQSSTNTSQSAESQVAP
jgi:tetratricopeptide (TPR) repeat protein